MKTINIYITKSEKKELYNLQCKYQVSLSTIVSCVSYWTIKILLDTFNEQQKQLFLENYIYKDKTNYKTSVKPKKLFEVLANMQHKNIVATNSIKMYLGKNIKDWTNNTKAINKYYREIDRELQMTIEPHWNYNQVNRRMPRILRENKEYYKKILGVD